jgi:hypothetical protein
MRQRLGFSLRPRHTRSGFWVSVWPLLFLLVMMGCRQEKTVMDRVDTATPTPTPSPSQAPTPAPSVVPQPSPTARAVAPPILPGTSANVPEMLTRPFTPQEFDKALEHLPPEVRQQIRGLGYAPSTKPAPPRPAPSPSSPQKRPGTP